MSGFGVASNRRRPEPRPPSPRSPSPRPPSSRPPFRALFRGRGLVLAAGLLITLAITVPYIATATAIVAYHWVVDGAIIAAWVASAAGLGLWPVRWAMGPRSDADTAVADVTPADDANPASPASAIGATRVAAGTPGEGLVRFVSAAALGIGLIGLAVLGLGLAGWLNWATGFLLLLPGLLLWVPIPLRRETGASKRPKPHNPDEARKQTIGKLQWAWLAACPFAAAVLVVSVVPPGVLWTPNEPHGYDIVEYHLQVPREWYEAGRIVPLRHNLFSYFPMGVEAHYLLAMHLDGGPWEGMYLAQMMHAALVTLGALGACGFAFRLAPRPRGAVLAGVALVTLPWLTQLAPIAYNEGGLLLFGTLALGIVLRATTDPLPRSRRLRLFALAGAMAGFACGAKLTAVPEVLLGVPAAAVVAAALRHLRHRSTSVAGTRGDFLAVCTGGVLYGLVGLVVFAPWLARNLAWTGNPIFPEAAGLLGKAHLTDEQVERWHSANHLPRPEQATVSGRLKALGDQVLWSWQFGFVLIPAGVIAMGLTARRPQTWFLGSFLVLFTFFWVGFTHLQGRFFVLAAPAATMAVACIDWDRWPRPVFSAALIVTLFACIPGAVLIHSRIAALLIGTAERHGAVDALGRIPLNWLTPKELEDLPPDARVTLVGESRAFWYQLPMRQLRYRTIFDIDTAGGRGDLAAWTAPIPGEQPWLGEQWFVIDPAELRRFHRTYRSMPPNLPPGLETAKSPLLIRADQATLPDTAAARER